MTDNRTTKLKPCPFCGGEAFLVENEPTQGFYVVECTNCASHGPMSRREYAIAAWNARYHCGLTDEDYNILLDELGVSERTCHIVKASRKYVLSDGTELYENGCSECNEYIGDGDNFCSNCGARVVG